MTIRALNKEILRLSVPSILANLTVPLVGLVDTALAGHLSGGAAAISAISIGSTILTLLYWNFAFLRTGTGGLTAQAFGAGDRKECSRILGRVLGLSLLIAAVVLLLQWPFVKLCLLCTQASPEVEVLAARYFFIRIWAAPATLSLMGFSGWFVGMQDSLSSMWKDLVVNGVNVVASIVLSRGIGSWEGLGFDGIAIGTVIAQYCGLLFCVIVCLVKYPHSLRLSRDAFSLGGSFFRMNGNLFLRSLFFSVIYVGYTLIASSFGDVLLACSSIMMQLLMLFSYFTDGFAYAGEALVGRFIGEGETHTMHRAVKYVFIWSMSIAVAFIGIYALSGEPLLRLMTSDESVIAACREYLPWLLVMPLFGCAAFTWDGIYLGATASVQVRNAMALAMLAFLSVWFVLRLLMPNCTAAMQLHCLLCAYFAHLLARTLVLSFSWKKVRGN